MQVQHGGVLLDSRIPFGTLSPRPIHAKLSFTLPQVAWSLAGTGRSAPMDPRNTAAKAIEAFGSSLYSFGRITDWRRANSEQFCLFRLIRMASRVRSLVRDVAGRGGRNL